MAKVYLQDIELARKSDIPDVSGKQDTLVSGENVKTVNNQSLLGSGNIDIDGSDCLIATYDQTSYSDVKAAIDADKAIIVNFPNNMNLIVPTYCTYAVGGNITMHGIYKNGDDTDVSIITLTPENAWTISNTALQPKLVSGTNIKTINNQNLLGSGNIDIEGGNAFLLDYETTDYSDVENAINALNAGSPTFMTNFESSIVTIVSGVYDGSTSIMCGFSGQRYCVFSCMENDSPIIQLDQEYDCVVDSAMSDNSLHPVQNNVVKAYVDAGEAALQAQIDGLGEPFRVKQWATNAIDVSMPYCTEDVANTGIPKLVFTIDDAEGADYQIVGMISYEVFDAASGGNRINCWPVCQFTGNGQKELSVRFMCAGTTRKNAKRINAWVLLKHR